MSQRRGALGYGAATVAFMLLFCGVTVVLPLLGGVSAQASCQRPPVLPNLVPDNSTWTPAQRQHAATVVIVGSQRGIPARGWVIAVATAIQESSLLNLANTSVPRSLTYPHDGVGNDHDSVGVFQQRVSPPDGQGAWGTLEELIDPRTAADKFYTALLPIDQWQTIRLTHAAQAVQHSGTPEAYQKWERAAETLVAFLLTGESCGAVGAAGWMMPVNGPINSGFRTPSRPNHDGIDIGAAKGTPIHAAAAGVVVKVACNASLGGQPYSCDVDGSPSVAGCGYYSEIRTGPYIHRYCHQLAKPYLTVGQQVAAGQVIGIVGSSGHSSGPHLHWEIHDVTSEGRATSENAFDPETFLRSMGVALPA